jgi:hypothetical protein
MGRMEKMVETGKMELKVHRDRRAKTARTARMAEMAKTEKMDRTELRDRQVKDLNCPFTSRQLK